MEARDTLAPLLRVKKNPCLHLWPILLFGNNSHLGSPRYQSSRANFCLYIHRMPWPLFVRHNWHLNLWLALLISATCGHLVCFLLSNLGLSFLPYCFSFMLCFGFLFHTFLFFIKPSPAKVHDRMYFIFVFPSVCWSVCLAKYLKKYWANQLRLWLKPSCVCVCGGGGGGKLGLMVSDRRKKLSGYNSYVFPSDTSRKSYMHH